MPVPHDPSNATSDYDLLIIGAGLAGLSLAYHLRQSGRRILLLEARERPGGRIHTLQPEDGPKLEMGATWWGRQHRALAELLAELSLASYPQGYVDVAWYDPGKPYPPQQIEVPPNPNPSQRIAGGSVALIEALRERLAATTTVEYGRVVEEISSTDRGVEVLLSTGEMYAAARAVVTVPPQVALARINFSPSLPDTFTAVARQTHTWMSESIKGGYTSRRPFWRDTAGALFSQTGPLTEAYDHEDRDQQRHAFLGFVRASPRKDTREKRARAVREQIVRYHGDGDADLLDYYELDWGREPHTHAPYELPVYAHQNNGHPALRAAIWAGKLYFGGTETAAEHPGYMSGAAARAKELAQSGLLTGHRA